MKKKYPSSPIATKGSRVISELELDFVAATMKWEAARVGVMRILGPELGATRHPSAWVPHLLGSGRPSWTDRGTSAAWWPGVRGGAPVSPAVVCRRRAAG